METCEPAMEDLIVNAKEHKLLKKFKKKLESRYNVEICMPKATSLDSDVIFVSIHGEELNRDSVKKFLSEKMSVPTKNDGKGDIVLITLSDSEDESSAIEPEASVIELPSETPPKFGNTLTFNNSRDDSVCIIETSINSRNTSDVIKNVSCQPRGKKRKRRKLMKDEKVRSKVLPSEASELCEVTSTTDDMVTKKPKLCESVRVLEEPAIRIEPPVDFIPLHKENKSINQRHESINKDSCLKSVKPNEINNDDIVVIDEPVSTITPRCLRPIVIDGSNVAMEHGKVSRSFSVKGIQLAIDYFLNRGHTQVTAFIPKFRRNPNPNRAVPTTDITILDDLERKQLVVFTPSRRLNGKCIASYDDRFIVQLAASNGGVIVSNDNFRDLINENDSFKEAIEERLLMFCFVGDVFMVPDDPLGRNGPTLNDYLSFPPNSKKT